MQSREFIVKKLFNEQDNEAQNEQFGGLLKTQVNVQESNFLKENEGQNSQTNFQDV